jgi:hypothetical protein
MRWPNAVSMVWGASSGRAAVRIVPDGVASTARRAAAPVRLPCWAWTISPRSKWITLGGSPGGEMCRQIDRMARWNICAMSISERPWIDPWKPVSQSIAFWMVPSNSLAVNGLTRTVTAPRSVAD